MRLKASVVVGDGVEDYWDLLAIGRAEAKRLLRTHEKVNMKDTLYSAKCGVHIMVFGVPEQIVADPPETEKVREGGFNVEAKPLDVRKAKSRKSLRKITSMRVFLVAALLGCLIIPSYSSLQAYQRISATGIVRAGMGKTVIWSDGSRETIQVTEKGKIFVNGGEVIAFGFHIARYGDWGDISDEAANKALDRLTQDGVRFMELGIHWWLTTQYEIESVLNFWMPKLYNHKMFVVLCMSDAVEEEGYGVPKGQPTVEWQMNRINIALARISQNKNWADIIFAFGFTWELDIFYTGTADQLEAYLSRLYPKVKDATASVIGDVPLIGKLVSGWGQGPEHLYSKSVVRWSDVPSIDIYYRIKDSELDYDWIAPRISLFHEVIDAVGKSGINVWYTEFGLWENNPLFDKEKLEYGLSEAGYNDLSLMMIWELWDRNQDGWSAFDGDGNPLDWYVRIAPYFPK